MQNAGYKETLAPSTSTDNDNDRTHLPHRSFTVSIQPSTYFLAMAPAAATSIEITVVSAQGLRNAGSFPFFWKRLRSYATVSLSMAGHCRNELPEDSRPAYTTKVDDRGGTDPRWDEKFRIPVDSLFVEDVRLSSICVRVYARGGSKLGWCRVPMEDVVILPLGEVSYLSYRLRDPRDGTRGHGIVSVAVKLDGLQANTGCSRLTSLDTREAVIGIPVTAPVFPVNFDRHCHRYNVIRPLTATSCKLGINALLQLPE